MLDQVPFAGGQRFSDSGRPADRRPQRYSPAREEVGGHGCVLLEVAWVEPPALVAVTVTRIVWPMSEAWSV